WLSLKGPWTISRSGQSRRPARVHETMDVSVFAASPNAYLVLERDGRIASANAAAAAVLGDDLPSLVGERLSALVAADEHDLVFEHISKAFTSKDPVACDVTARTKRRDSVLLELVSSRLEPDGERLLTAMTDVTDKRRAEQVLDFMDRAAAFFQMFMTPEAI